MVHYEKQRKGYVKNSSQILISDQYLYYLNDLKHPGSDYEQSPTTEGSPNLVNFIKLYWEYCYYLCISPFRFKESGEKSFEFRVQNWTPQKVLCGIMHFLCLCRIIAEARLSTPNSVEEYFPTQYFLLLMNIFNTIYKTVFIKRLWCNQSDFLRIANFIATERAIPAGSAKMIRRPMVIRVVFSFYTSMSFLSLLAGKFFITEISDWSPSWWYRRLIGLTKYTFFYGMKLNSQDVPSYREITLLDNFMMGINIISLISRYLLGYFADLCLLVMTITLWSASYSMAKRFTSNDIDNPNGHWTNKESNDNVLTRRKLEMVYDVDQNIEKTWHSIYKNFKAIRVVSHLINKGLGSIGFWFLGEAVMSYSVNMDALLVARDYYVRLNSISFYVCTFGILFVSADICKQLESIKLWLADDNNRRNVPPDQVNIVLHEMLAKDIGIRAGNIFTITYSVAGTFLGTIVTYFIICVEQNGKP